MYDFLCTFLKDRGFIEQTAALVSYVFILVLTGLSCYLIHIMSEAIIKTVVNKVVIKRKNRWLDILLRQHVIHHAANMLIPCTILFYQYALPVEHVAVRDLIIKVVGIIAVTVSAFLISALINAVDEIYQYREISKTKPLHGFFQVIKILAFIICFLIGVSILAGQNPITLIGGIGAMTAVITFIFKDAILGFAAGQQLISNDLIRIGDWVEIPKHNANGNVVEISMTTVKVENFDLTFTSIPTYSLITDSFINWRGMVESGVRRIKRAIHIDLRDVRFCDKEMLDGFERITILKDYIINKRAEIDQYNEEHGVDVSCVVNGRHITNIGAFRAYIQRYIGQHPGLSRDMTVIVRQLDSDRHGIPLEIIAYANTIESTKYEEIQADIFDHLYAVSNEFGLRVYLCQVA